MTPWADWGGRFEKSWLGPGRLVLIPLLGPFDFQGQKCLPRRHRNIFVPLTEQHWTPHPYSLGANLHRTGSRDAQQKGGGPPFVLVAAGSVTLLRRSLSMRRATASSAVRSAGPAETKIDGISQNKQGIFSKGDLIFLSSSLRGKFVFDE